MNDTWTWNGTTWAQLSPATSPPVRYAASMAYDPATAQIVLFGGIGDDNYASLNDTWTWNGTTWTQKSPATIPATRFGASMAYDPATAQMVLFDGDDNDTTILGDTWTWNGSTWTQISPSTSPPARWGASMVYDQATSQLVLFGGDGSAYFNDTWTWNGTTWTELFPPTNPPARWSASMDYDPATLQIVLFGGVVNGGNLTGDTWAYEAENTYAVTYNGNGSTSGSVPVDASSPYVAGATVTVLANTGSLVQAGYTFSGWNTAANGTGTSYAASGTATFTMPDAGVTLYAQWTANTDTVTFNSEGGSAVSSESGLDGTTITLPGAPTYPGYTFDGWFASPTGGTALTSPYTLSGSVTLYAQWTANATDDYSYAANGGTGTAPASGSGLDGTTITLAANPFTDPGHTFAGWSDGTSTYGAGATYTLSSDGTPIVLTAQWTANATDDYSYAANGGTGTAPASGSGLDGTTITLAANPFTDPGHTFAGWSDGTSTYGAGATYTLSSDGTPIVLTAQWTANATDDYSYAANGGTGTAPASGSGLDGTTITLAANPFTDPGHTFAGWSDGTSTYGAGATYTLSSDGTPIVLTAQWTANATDDYSYAANGGTGTAPASGSGLDGTTITLAANPFTDPGHTFAGWSDGTSTYGAGATYTLSSDGTPIVLTAQWTANATDIVTFNSEGGSAVAEQSGLDGTTITLPGAPSYAGHSFDGWFAAPTGGSALDLALHPGRLGHPLRAVDGRADHLGACPFERGDAIGHGCHLGRLRLQCHQRRVLALRWLLWFVRSPSRHGHSHLLRMALQLEHHDGFERLVRAVVGSLRSGWERLQLPREHHCQQRAPGDQRDHSQQRCNTVWNRRHLGCFCLECHQRGVLALRWLIWLLRLPRWHGHSHQLRMALQLEHHDGSQRLVRAVVGSLRSGWERLQFPCQYDGQELIGRSI